MIRKIFSICIMLFVMTSCGYKEGVIQKAEKSYLKFVGNWQNAVVQIDDTSKFRLDDYLDDRQERTSPENKLYQVSPGKHVVKVFKNGSTVVNRILLLENQAIMEVFVP